MIRIITSSIFTCFLLLADLSYAQQVGVTIYEKGEAMEGYTFFSPNRSNNSYLVDNCGYLVNSWQRNARPGLGSYFLDNGLIMRTAKTNNGFFPQYSEGGLVELVDWDNNVDWAIQVSNNERIQHHDAAIMPNGNVLILGWEKIVETEQIALGRDLSEISSPTLWGEFVYEVEKTGTNTFNIVWEWHLKDHLVQDYDASKQNFGAIVDNPGRVDINYKGPSWWGERDWWHCNAINYSVPRDEIVINSRNNHELWIIDHSTTSQEAAGTTGGDKGKGGDLLYRWGNPEAYDSGDQADLRMYGSHGIHFIDESLPNAGKILYFNNGDRRPGFEAYSTAEMIVPPLDANGNYFMQGGVYGPTEPEIVYQAPNPEDFHSTYLSNVQQMSNGHFLINEGGSGRYFEINDQKDIVWEYHNPVDFTGPVSQGQGFGNFSTFRAYKFPADYSGFAGKDLTPGGVIQFDDPMHFCFTSELTESFPASIFSNFDLQSKMLRVNNPESRNLRLTISDFNGRLLSSEKANLTQQNLDLGHLSSGVYLVAFMVDNSRSIKKILVP